MKCRVKKRLLIILGCLLGVALLVVAAKEGVVIRNYIRRFGDDPYAALVERRQRLSEIWWVIDDYHSFYGAWPRSDADLELAGIDCTTLLRAPRWSNGTEYIIEYGDWDTAENQIIVHDPGLWFPKYDEDELLRWRIALRLGGILERYDGESMEIDLIMPNRP